jgi:hypothetical protein
MRAFLTFLAVFAAGAGAAVAPAAFGDHRSAAGTLELRATFGTVSEPVACPPSLPQDNTECRARIGSSLVPGLGKAADEYTWQYRIGPPSCAGILVKPLATNGRLVTAKGQINVALSDGASCVDLEPVRNEPQAFTITGGTGAFAGASGSGRVERSLSGDTGTEAWIGTLAVSGLEFDLTAPTLAGATPKTVRTAKGAKTVKVTFRVTATDAVDGTVPTVCQPKSGSRFKVGRTTVRCTATDSSANTGKASFVVIVKARR